MSQAEETVSGHVAEGFEEVEQVFRGNFALGLEVGAACAVWHRGEMVVDLWGGLRHKAQGTPWERDTLVPVFSTSKGISGMTMIVAHARGYLDFDEPVASYWPEFAQQGKGSVTVRQLLSHQAGLCVIDEPLGIEALADPDRVAAALAKQEMVWEPGSRHGYHAVSLGWYESELIRRCDPAGRTLGEFFQEEIADPLDLEFYVGLPADVPDERIAHMETQNLLKMVFHLDKLPWRFVLAFMNPWSLSSRTIRNPSVFNNPKNINRRELLSLQVPAVCGLGQVRSMAKAYGVMACGGGALDVTMDTLEHFYRPAAPPSEGLFDHVLQAPMLYSLGYFKPFETFPFGTDDRAFGTHGAGGSFAYADPALEVGFAYGMNRMGFYVFGDPRERALREAMERCVRRR